MGNQENDDTREHNVRQIARYLEFAPSFIGPGAPPDEPMGKKHKGTSRPPATEKAMEFWEENLDAARLLNPRIEELRRSKAAWRGVYFSDLLTALYADPTAVSRWHDEDRRRLAAFRKMCGLLADSIKAEYGPERRITVKVPRRYGRVRSRREAAYEDRRGDTEDALRRIHARWERVKSERGVGSEEAKRILHQERDIHPSKTERAITFVNRERGGDGDGEAA